MSRFRQALLVPDSQDVWPSGRRPDVLGLVASGSLPCSRCCFRRLFVKPERLEVVGGSEGQAVQHDTVLVLQVPSTVQISEIARDLSRRRCHTANSN